MVVLSTNFRYPFFVVTQVSEERMAAWMSLMQVHSAVVDVLEEELQAKLSLPLSWHEVLVRLAEAPDGRLRMQELARSVLLSKSGVTRLVDRMETAGLVERGSCPSDRRVTYATITKRGRRTLDRALPIFVKGFDQSFGLHLSDADTRALRSALRKVLAGNGHAEAPTCPSAYTNAAPAAR